MPHTSRLETRERDRESCEGRTHFLFWRTKTKNHFLRRRASPHPVAGGSANNQNLGSHDSRSPDLPVNAHPATSSQNISASRPPPLTDRQKPCGGTERRHVSFCG